jgi:hypothetical protein
MTIDTSINRNFEQIMKLSNIITSSLLPASQAGTYNLTIGGKEYPLSYEIGGGTINNITADKDLPVLLLNINSTDDGFVRIVLPRNITDSKSPDNRTDEEYLVFADAQQTGFRETGSNNQSRTLVVDFENGVEQIEIIGSQATLPASRKNDRVI